MEFRQQNFWPSKFERDFCLKMIIISNIFDKMNNLNEYLSILSAYYEIYTISKTQTFIFIE